MKTSDNFPSQTGKGKKYHHATSSPRGSGGGGNDKKHEVRHSSSNLPPALASRLHQLFNSVEKEFEALYLENNQLRQRVSLLEKGDTTVFVCFMIYAGFIFGH